VNTPGPRPSIAVVALPSASQALLDALAQPAWVADVGQRLIVAANAAAAALLGREGSAAGADAEAALATAEDFAWWQAAAAGEVEPLVSEIVLPAPEGAAPMRFTRSIRPLAADGVADRGAPSPLVLVLLHDHTARQREADEREALVAQLQATLEATADGILVTDLAGRIVSFNRRFAELWDLPRELLERRDDRAVFDWMRRSVVGPEAYERRLAQLGDAALQHGDDRLELHAGLALHRVSRPLLARGRPRGRVWSFRDLTESVAAAARIEELALHDALTGLPNRRALAEHVEQEAARSRREGAGFALMVLDIDRFRQINDGFGHHVGDRVLVDVAGRIKGCLRADDRLARIGGDQFALVLQGADAAAAERAARRILARVAQPCTIEGAAFTLTCSIGVALCPLHGQGLDALVRHAEGAMRAVKDGGRGSFRLHGGEAGADLRSHMRLDHAMRQALVSGRFRLAYQPQVELGSGRIVGAEALLRWRDPELGEVSPGRFIPVAEDTGFIVAIGDWVLSQAVRQAAHWHDRGHPMPIAINVSALQFQQDSFTERVASVLAVSGLPPSLLELEMTESILLRDADEALHRLHALARLGVRLSIDDFGTGYSSLAYLKRFPIGKLKIDRSFVTGLPDDGRDAGIVRAILQMAQALGMKVVAEGVETEAQHRFLVEAGCHHFQGFLFAPGLDVASFEDRVAAGPVPRPAGTAVPGPRIRLVTAS
jgi:diguanylate cyclase (GGDEF)-like protein